MPGQIGDADDLAGQAGAFIWGTGLGNGCAGSMPWITPGLLLAKSLGISADAGRVFLFVCEVY